MNVSSRINIGRGFADNDFVTITWTGCSIDPAQAMGYSGATVGSSGTTAPTADKQLREEHARYKTALENANVCASFPQAKKIIREALHPDQPGTA